MSVPTTAARPVIRSATRKDIAEFSPVSLSRTVTAIVAEVEGRIVAFAGFAHIGGRIVGFFEFNREALAYPVTIHRTAKRLIREQLQKHKYIYATPDEDEPRAEAWLASLGFRRLEDVPDNLWRLDRDDS